MAKLGYKTIGKDSQGNPIFKTIIPFPGNRANSCDARESAHGAFSDSAPILLKNGFSALPIAPGKKYPAGVKGWSARCEEPTTLQEIQGSALAYRAYGVGVACGYNDLTAVDVVRIPAKPPTDSGVIPPGGAPGSAGYGM